MEKTTNLKYWRWCNEHGIFKHLVENQMMNEGFNSLRNEMPICWIVHIIFHNEIWAWKPSLWNSNDHWHLDAFQVPKTWYARLKVASFKCKTCKQKHEFKILKNWSPKPYVQVWWLKVRALWSLTKFWTLFQEITFHWLL